MVQSEHEKACVLVTVTAHAFLSILTKTRAFVADVKPVFCQAIFSRYTKQKQEFIHRKHFKLMENRLKD
jgi:hypothetical protein